MNIISKEEFDKKENISHQMRGSILARFAILEVGIQEFVISNFLNESDSTNHSKLFQDIHSEIFQNTFFNYILLRDLFLKVLRKVPDLDKKFNSEFASPLKKLYEIRNIAAHGIPEVNNADKVTRTASDQSEFCIKSGHLPGPYFDETVESLYGKFNKEYKKIADFINHLPGVTDKTIISS